MRSFIRNHPVGVATGTVALIVGLAWLAFGFFGVHTLFVDDVVDEAGPIFEPAPTSGETTETPADSPAVSDVNAAAGDAETATASGVEGPATSNDPAATAADPSAPTAAAGRADAVAEYRGVFEGDAHPTAGDAIVLGNGTGQRFLRLENFETSNGPDVNVYLVNRSTGDVSDYIDLGDLKGNIGDQNYEIPAGVDLDVYDDVVIWCVRFGVGFGDAQLTAA